MNFIEGDQKERGHTENNDHIPLFLPENKENLASLEPNDQLPYQPENKKNLASLPIPNEFLRNSGNTGTNPWPPLKHDVFVLN